MMDDEVREFLEQNDPVGEHYVPPKYHDNLPPLFRKGKRHTLERTCWEMRRAKKVKNALSAS